ncbi:hypothetical protein F5890DRAFT_1540638 [Lentinula detonsa]|uniref:DUF1776-domain-containing protein n=1 Tax=Lentinula detonsa TaxID=2804962 RepID=A0AA38PRM3_9AGAR|nr:hypothetical protein F5890DRAFT_1540638 [Lentinula detonsa]
MDTMEKLEEYLDVLEEYVLSSLAAASPPGIRERISQLWEDFARYGPTIPTSIQSRIPGLGDFEIPPPPPPPPPKTWSQKGTEWVERHPWIAGGLVVSVGTGLLVGYGYRRKYLRARRARTSKIHTNSHRRQVVVVLGGDTPYGLSLILALEQQGYIIITSVSSTESGESLERTCHGWVRALALDPNRPSDLAVQEFLRSLASTMARRFPITAPGDPYVSLGEHPYIHSVISLLTLPSPSSSSLNAPLEHLSLSSTYIAHLTQAQIIPLQTIQALLPLLRNAHVPHTSKDKKTIIVCLPAAQTYAGLPFEGVGSMTAASTSKALDVLRKEISLAKRTGKEMMRNISVVEVDVDFGSFGFETTSTSSPQDVYKAMEKWTASEKVTYGPAFASIMTQKQALGLDGVDVFVNTIVRVVGNNGRFAFGLGSFATRLGLGKIFHWFNINSSKVLVRAGANTCYNHFISLLHPTLSNSLTSFQDFILTTRLFGLRPRATVPLPPDLHRSSTAASASSAVQVADPSLSSLSSEEGGSEAEADVESNASDSNAKDTLLAESTWISVPEAKEALNA